MSDDAQAQQQAEQLRLKANGLYKERKFDEAREAYEQAWQLYPKDIAVLNNLGAVYFEQGNYDKAIETCEKAVEEGRELRADYKLVAK